LSGSLIDGGHEMFEARKIAWNLSFCEILLSKNSNQNKIIQIRNYRLEKNICNRHYVSKNA